MRKNLLTAEIYTLDEINPYTEGKVVLLISSSHMDGAEICDEVGQMAGFPFGFFELKVNNWDEYLTPWPVAKGNRSFAGKAGELLLMIREEVLPEIRSMVGEDTEIIIAGYSLGGLFSLWSMYECDLFSGAVCCSGSLWYPGWKEYAEENAFASCGNSVRNVSIYMSLGNKEKNTRDVMMKVVEENTLWQVEKLKADVRIREVHFDMNEGGHFNDPAGRMVRGIRWGLA